MKYFALASALIILTSCASQPFPDAYDPPGFWMGIVHGLVAPFALIGHFFDSTIRIYAFPNSGGWYDFGYILGVSTICGGGAKAA